MCGYAPVGTTGILVLMSVYIILNILNVVSEFDVDRVP